MPEFKKKKTVSREKMISERNNGPSPDLTWWKTFVPKAVSAIQELLLGTGRASEYRRARLEILFHHSSSHDLLPNVTPSSPRLGDPEGPTWGRSHCGCLQADHAVHLLECGTEKTRGGQKEKLGLSHLPAKPSCMGHAQIVIRAARESYRLTIPGETAPRQDP